MAPRAAGPARCERDSTASPIITSMIATSVSGNAIVEAYGHASWPSSRVQWRAPSECRATSPVERASSCNRQRSGSCLECAPAAVGRPAAAAADRRGRGDQRAQRAVESPLRAQRLRRAAVAAAGAACRVDSAGPRARRAPLPQRAPRRRARTAAVAGHRIDEAAASPASSRPGTPAASRVDRHRTEDVRRRDQPRARKTRRRARGSACQRASSASLPDRASALAARRAGPPGTHWRVRRASARHRCSGRAARASRRSRRQPLTPSK